MKTRFSLVALSLLTLVACGGEDEKSEAATEVAPTTTDVVEDAEISIDDKAFGMRFGTNMTRREIGAELRDLTSKRRDLANTIEALEGRISGARESGDTQAVAELLPKRNELYALRLALKERVEKLTEEYENLAPEPATTN